MTTLEPIVFLLRSGEDHHKYGDPYQFTATVVKIGSTAHIYAGVGTSPKRSEIREVLRQYGFDQAMWERIENGILSELNFKL